MAVRFGDCRAGWIRITVQIGNESCRLSATDVCDPFVRFIAWLEAIAEGGSAASWSVPQEGLLTRLVFVADQGAFDRGPDRLVILDDWWSGDGVRSFPVDRRALIATFYTAFRTFAQTDYRPREWEWNRAAAELEQELTQERWDALKTWPRNPWSGHPLADLRSPIVERFLHGSTAVQLSLPWDRKPSY